MAKDKDRIFELAQKISQKRNLKKVLKEYKTSLEQNPNDFKTRMKLADVYLRRGEVAKAIDQYLQIAAYYIKEELDLKAIATLKKILVLNPSVTEASYRLADLYTKRGLLGEARVQYQKILKTNPKEKKATERLKLIETQTAQDSTQIKRILEDKLRDRDPVWGTILEEFERQLTTQVSETDYQAHYNLGIALKEMGIFNKAIEKLEIALRDPGLEFDSHIMIATCHHEVGNFDAAIEYLNKALNIRNLTNKQCEHIYYQLGQTLEVCGQTEKALDAFNKVNELRGGDASDEFQSRLENLKKRLAGG